MKNTTSIKVPKKYEHMIEEIYQDSDGYWVYSKAGFHFAYMGGECHTGHEDTQRDLLMVIRTLETCTCKDCKDCQQSRL
jgi:hypothetical protein